MQLTQQQQEIIGNSIWIVDTVLRRAGLERDADLRQDAILYMCNCLLRYDSSKNAKWETYAYANISLYVKRVSAKERLRKSKNVPLSKCAPITSTEQTDKNSCCLLLPFCSMQERQIISLIAKGYRYTEVRNALNISQRKLRRILNNIKYKVKEFTPPN